jgi:CheY-like chemotaxis protein
VPRATILLVEDSKIQRLQSERILSKAGYAVINANDGEQALQLARASLPDLILLDMLLPKLGGEQVLEMLKADRATAHIPVIALSGLTQTNEAKLMQAGAAGYFEKSRFEDSRGHDVLLHMLERVLRESSPKKQANAGA